MIVREGKNKKERKKSNPRKAWDAQYSDSPPVGQGPAHPPAVIGLSCPTPPVHILCLTVCGMEYPKDRVGSPALAMALPAPHAPPPWQCTKS